MSRAQAASFLSTAPAHGRSLGHAGENAGARGLRYVPEVPYLKPGSPEERQWERVVQVVAKRLVECRTFHAPSALGPRLLAFLGGQRLVGQNLRELFHRVFCRCEPFTGDELAQISAEPTPAEGRRAPYRYTFWALKMPQRTYQMVLGHQRRPYPSGAGTAPSARLAKQARLRGFFHRHGMPINHPFWGDLFGCSVDGIVACWPECRQAAPRRSASLPEATEPAAALSGPHTPQEDRAQGDLSATVAQLSLRITELVDENAKVLAAVRTLTQERDLYRDRCGRLLQEMGGQRPSDAVESPGQTIGTSTERQGPSDAVESLEQTIGTLTSAIASECQRAEAHLKACTPSAASLPHRHKRLCSVDMTAPGSAPNSKRTRA